MVRTSDFRKSRRVRNFDSLKSFGTSRTNASPSVQTAVVIFTVVRKAQSVSLCVLLVSVITTILPRTWAPTVRRRRCDYRTYGIASDVISRRFNDKCDLAHSDRPRDEHTRRIRARAHAHNVVHVIRRTHTCTRYTRVSVAKSESHANRALRTRGEWCRRSSSALCISRRLAPVVIIFEITRDVQSTDLAEYV